MNQMACILNARMMAKKNSFTLMLISVNFMIRCVTKALMQTHMNLIKKLKEIDPRMFLLCVNDGPASVEVADDTGDWYEAYDFPKNHFNYKGLTRLLKRIDQSKFEELQKTIDEFNKKRLKQKRR